MSTIDTYELRRHLNIYRRRALWKDVGIIFIHIPKAAGTSINRALYGRGMGHYTALELQRWLPVTAKRLPTFTVVRNPYSRALSAYEFVRRGGTTDMGVRPRASYILPSFASFESFACEWLDSQDEHDLDFVFRRQVDYTTGGDLQHLGRVEDLRPTEMYLSEVLGREVPIPRINALVEANDHSAAKMSIRARAAIHEFYRDDFREFGYKK